MHSLPLITTLVLAFGLALVFGFLAERFGRAPALVGFLLAGIAAGQHTPGPFADPELAHQLSEIGVMLLMFGVGLHFSVRDLMSVKGIAIPGAVGQMALATLLGAVAAHWFWDWSWGAGIVFGLSLSCASTVVLIKALEVRGQLTNRDGRIAMGWLVVEDIATVLILVLLPPLSGLLGAPGSETAGGNELMKDILMTLVNVAAFIAVMFIVGRRAMPWLLYQVAKTGSRELFTLFVLAAALGVAYAAAAIFHVSFALGAFFAGMVMRESRFAHRAATESIPLQDAFSVLFFVGVGMLFDWHILIEAPGQVLVALLVVVFGKSLAAFGIVLLLKRPLKTALTVGASLAQIGEFSFILAGEAVALGLSDNRMVNLIVGAAILSIALNPVLFELTGRVEKLLVNRWAWARRAAEIGAEETVEEERPDTSTRPIFMAGDGPMVLDLARRWRKSGMKPVVLTTHHEVAQELEKAGVDYVECEPDDATTLENAGLGKALSYLIFANGAETLRYHAVAERIAPNVPFMIVADDPGVWVDIAEKEGSKVRLLTTGELIEGKLWEVVLRSAFRKQAEEGAQKQNAPEGASDKAESAEPAETEARDRSSNGNSTLWKKLLRKVNISKLRKGN